MILRFVYFLLCQLAGGLLGWWQAGPWGAAVGAALAAWACFGLDSWRGERLLRWLRQGDLGLTPHMRGVWGEAADRARRLHRQQQVLVDESQQRLQDVLSAVQASPNGVIFLDAEGRIEWCNQIAAGHFGIDVERDVLQSIGNLVRNPDFSAYYAAQEYGAGVVFAGAQSEPGRPVRLSVQLNPYGQGRKLLLSRDVTALEQAEAMRRDFVANVSHEIRTPLTVLTGFVETLQTLSLEPQEQMRYLALMAQQAARMQNVVNGLLTLSRLEGSPQPGISEWTSVKILLQYAENEARALTALLASHSTRSHVLQFPAPALAHGFGEIAGVQTELQSAMSNLIGNAVRYTPAGGTIVVEWLPQSDGSAVFSVADTGPGIDPVHIPRLTERFYRVDRSRSRDTGGTGLGLSIVKHVLQRHGAALHIDSVPGKGSVFSVHFPANRLRLPVAPEVLGTAVNALA
ncbi:MAG: phosphate regulon sensor histidine kinase PhoR [Simplicispira sp.]|nr:phosphate regulon sensor histidine kinase PhoR [Simplicispira sp.]